jgi:hypothetical protein
VRKAATVLLAGIYITVFLVTVSHLPVRMFFRYNEESINIRRKMTKEVK